MTAPSEADETSAAYFAMTLLAWPALANAAALFDGVANAWRAVRQPRLFVFASVISLLEKNRVLLGAGPVSVLGVVFAQLGGPLPGVMTPKRPEKEDLDNEDVDGLDDALEGGLEPGPARCAGHVAATRYKLADHADTLSFLTLCVKNVPHQDVRFV